MNLTTADLEAIRQLIREELALPVRSTPVEHGRGMTVEREMQIRQMARDFKLKARTKP